MTHAHRDAHNDAHRDAHRDAHKDAHKDAARDVPEVATLVVLGAGGDLTGRYLLPALARLEAVAALPRDLRILAVDRGELSDATFREHAEQRLAQHLPDADEGVVAGLLARLHYRRADVTSGAELGAALPDVATTAAAFYLALPNTLFGPTLEALDELDVAPGSKLVVEKPFGTDLDDARRLNEAVRGSFGEKDVFRVDHFLAKQTVLDILGLRFANRVFEPVWNNLHVERVDIVWDETVALEGRAGYYDRAGALRDMVQNHLLQLLALVAMEPPTSLDERDLRDRKADVLRAVRPPSPSDMATRTTRARYTAGSVVGRDVPAYVDEDGVDPGRDSETYAEVVLEVDNWRWSGVPFRLRTGKALGRDRREIVLHFRPVSHQPFGEASPDLLRFTLDPHRIELEVNLNGAGDPFDLERASLAADFPQQALPPYSRLFIEILEGDPTLSIRGDEAEEGWRIVEPVLAAWEDGAVPLQEYAAGTDGPG